ncbi:MAG: hypothetical protein IJG31_05125 [Fusobacterium sp.]|nr:hypothetical protein [Fusobacterium sp.]
MILEEFIEIANLLDIYSELLSGKQKEYMIDHFENDLSLSEIAKNNNVSRQAVYDNIKRGTSLLNEYESKLGFYSKKKSLLESLKDLKIAFTEEKLDKIIDEII